MIFGLFFSRLSMNHLILTVPFSRLICIDQSPNSIIPPNIKRLQSDKKRIWRRFRSDKSNSLIREEYKLACGNPTVTLWMNFITKLNLRFYLNVMRQPIINSFGEGWIGTHLSLPWLTVKAVQSMKTPQKPSYLMIFFSSVYTVDNGIFPNFSSRIDSSVFLDSVIFTPFCIRSKLLRLK